VMADRLADSNPSKRREWFSGSLARGVRKSPGWDALAAKFGPSDDGKAPAQAGNSQRRSERDR